MVAHPVYRIIYEIFYGEQRVMVLRIERTYRHL